MQIVESGLIEQVKRGDQRAFQELFRPFKNKAFGLCFSLVGNTEDARDVLQEVLIKVYKNIRHFRGNSSFYTWFYAIVVNTARDFLRKKKNQQSRLNEDIADLGANPAGPVLNEELKGLLERSLSTLAERQRLSFVMRHVHGMKIEQIARILHCRPATVKVHLFRAVRNLQKKLMPYLKDSL